MTRDASPCLRLLVALLLAWPLSVTALPVDRDQPTRIVSDRFEGDQRQGVAVYEGSVELTQGRVSIEAERLTIHRSDNNTVSELIAEGQPARYRQRPGDDSAEVTATAGSIRYSVEGETLHLSGNAHLAQDGATMSGEEIAYDIVAEQVTATGEGEDSRIEMVIPPRDSLQD